jgi:hypothetical protein
MICATSSHIALPLAGWLMASAEAADRHPVGRGEKPRRSAGQQENQARRHDVVARLGPATRASATLSTTNAGARRRK